MAQCSSLGRAIVSIFLASNLCFTGGAIAQGLPNQMQSVVLLELIAGRGVECGLLPQWASVILRGQTQDIVRDWTREERVGVAAEIAAKSAQTPCDSTTLTVWINGAKPNFDTELLVHYLVAYRVLASMETPPRVFEAIALRKDYAPALDVVNAKIDEIAASGKPLEGGKPMPEFAARIEQGIAGFAAVLAGKEADIGNTSPDQAAAWIAQAALAIELWLDEQNAASADAEVAE